METSVVRWIHINLHSITWLNYAMKYVTLLGEHAAVCIVLCIILIMIKKTRRCGIAFAISLIFDFVIVNAILKNVVARERPWFEYSELEDYYSRYGIFLPSDYSFPSGHAAVCFCSATILAIFYKAKVAIPAYLIALLVALSRVWLCVHYPTDVIAGAIIGSACAVIGYFIFKYAEIFYFKYKNKMLSRKGGK